jgi:hypothetical protein
VIVCDTPFAHLDRVLDDASLGPALVANVQALLAGRAPPMVRNPQALPRWLQRFAPAASPAIA